MSSSRTSRRRSSGSNSVATAASKRNDGLKSQAAGQITYGFIKEVSPNRSAGKTSGHSKNSSTGSRRHSHQSPSVAERSGSLNRWSQSTTSSISTTNGRNREKSYIRRLSLGSPFQGASSVLRRSPSPKRMASTNPRDLDQKSPEVHNRTFQSIPQIPARPAPLVPVLSDRLGQPKTAWQHVTSVESNTAPITSKVAPINSNYNRQPAGTTVTGREIYPTGIAPGRDQSEAESQIGQTERPVPIVHQRAGSSPNKTRKMRASREDDRGTTSPRRARSKQEKEKKIMLSSALKQAQAAVELDNTQDYEGAIEAYNFACTLLGQVLEKSSSEDDKRKLSQIRVTYELRIQELEFLERHQSIDTNGWHEETASQVILKPVIRMPVENAEVGHGKALLPGQDAAQIGVTTTIIDSKSMTGQSTEGKRSMTQPSQTSFGHEQERSLISNSSSQKGVMPSPLTPRRLPSAESPIASDIRELEPIVERTVISRDGQTVEVPARTVSRGLPNSWLDGPTEMIEDSQPSMDETQSTHFRSGSGGTEAEFDAALDAAVEAAYDGYDPYDDSGSIFIQDQPSTSNRLEPLFASSTSRANGNEPDLKLVDSRHLQKVDTQPQSSEFNDDLDLSAEEEERMLEEMTKEYMPDSLLFSPSSQPSLPRQSDSSGFSGRTWKSSTASSGFTAATSLSTVGENTTVPNTLSLPSSSRNSNSTSAGTVPFLPPLGKTPPPILAPPNTAIPMLSLPQSPSVRDRRLSGAKRLKIETAPMTSTSRPQTRDRSLSPPKSYGSSASTGMKQIPGIPNTALKSGDSTQSGKPWSTTKKSFTSPRQQSTESTSTVLSDTTALPPMSGGLAENNIRHSPKSSPQRAFGKFVNDRNFMKNNSSSLSLKEAPASASEEAVQPNTPMDFGFLPLTTVTSNRQILPQGSNNTPLTTPISSSFSRVSKTPLTTPVNSTFSRMADDQLFDGDFHEPKTPGSPNPLASNGPSPLEPCPSSFLLRPFWLMRCLYQTIANPRGGYMSTRLFVPRGVWMVQNVKLKAVEDKISNCDLLTAALLKLGAVDTLDADAVLEEMQVFENVLEQVRNNLSKKLGNEVGMQGLATLFKDAAPNGPEGGQAGDSSTMISNSSKTGSGKFSSWRRLRSKNSGVSLTQSYNGSREQQVKDPPLMSTVPMTTSPGLRSPKPDYSKPQCVGPNANYMNALARLFEAVQVLDQIARQVEDPGLRLTSKTHVGLELGARHAAEFFAFFICRFVVTDVTLLLEKFIKRASEWVMV